MGQSMSWFAVSSKPQAVVLEALELVDTDERVHPSDCEIAGAQIPGGPYLVFLNRFWHPMIEPASMQALSENTCVVGYSEYENVNVSLAFEYRNGQLFWQASHQLDLGPENLIMKGQLPDGAQGVLDSAIQKHKEQGHDAVLSVPGALAQQACGFDPCDRSLRFTKLVAQESEPLVQAGPGDDEASLGCRPVFFLYRQAQK